MRLTLLMFFLVNLFFVTFSMTEKNVYAVAHANQTLQKRIAIKIIDRWHFESSASWENDISNSIQSLTSFLKKKFPSSVIKELEILGSSTLADKNYIEIAQKNSFDLLVLGSTTSTLKKISLEESNPWMVQDNDPLWNKDRFEAAVTCEWRVIDIAKGEVLGIISNNFFSAPGAGGKSSYSPLSARNWAKEQIFEEVNPSVGKILQNSIKPGSRQNYEITFQGVEIAQAEGLSQSLKNNTIVDNNSVQLMKAEGDDIVFSCNLLDHNTLKILVSLNRTIPKGFGVKKIDNGKIIVSKSKLSIGPASAVDGLAIRTIPIQAAGNLETKNISNDKSAINETGSKYHALIIGINDYSGMPKLKTAVKDARDIEKLLREKYKFNTLLLINAERAEVLKGVSYFRNRLKQEDHLLIYYAGHGWLDEGADEGYWFPKDAAVDNMDNWISNTTITSQLRAIHANHVLVVSDSCYSGKLTRSISIKGFGGAETGSVNKDSEYYHELLRKKSRTVLSSGGLEPVSDRGENNNSIFAYAFLLALNDNKGYLDGRSLLNNIMQPVTLNSDQTPEYSELKKAGHLGGDFVFIIPENG